MLTNTKLFTIQDLIYSVIGKRKVIDSHQVDDDNPDISYYRPGEIPRSGPRPQSVCRAEPERILNHATPKGGAKTYPPIPSTILETSPLLLNLGGYNKQPGWINVNIQPQSYGTDFVAEILRTIEDLHGIPDESVDALYCSHALEHVKIENLESTLNEWSRVLKPGGYLFLSVPDMVVMARYENIDDDYLIESDYNL